LEVNAPNATTKTSVADAISKQLRPFRMVIAELNPLILPTFRLGTSTRRKQPATILMVMTYLRHHRLQPHGASILSYCQATKDPARGCAARRTRKRSRLG